MVQTPMGEYNPDWAIVQDEDSEGKLYLVRETKGSQNSDDLRGREQKKVECGQAHFHALGWSPAITKFDLPETGHPRK
jgi:type III restriction enzyme